MDVYSHIIYNNTNSYLTMEGYFIVYLIFPFLIYYINSHRII